MDVDVDFDLDNSVGLVSDFNHGHGQKDSFLQQKYCFQDFLLPKYSISILTHIPI